MTGLLDNVERPSTTTRRGPLPVDGDLAEAVSVANDKWELERREQDEAAIADILRESLKKIYGPHIEEPKEPSAWTRARYISEFSKFALWCLSQHLMPFLDPPRSLPAKPELVASYLHHLATSGAHSKLRSVSAAISRAHRLAQLPDPCEDSLVSGVLRAARQKAPPKKKRRRKANGARHH